jgi:hypothetical protein
MTVAMRSVVVYEREVRREKEGTITKRGKQRARATRKMGPSMFRLELATAWKGKGRICCRQFVVVGLQNGRWNRTVSLVRDAYVGTSS